MKYSHLLAVFILFWCATDAHSQDTVNIKGITVKAKRIKAVSGYKETQIDTLALKQQEYLSLAEVLSHHSPIFIKSYGQSGIATASFRGTGASHTKVLWNGVEMNNPMLGQTDFSMIPAAMVDHITLSHGGAGISKSGGSLGGSVQLQNNADWMNRLGVELKQSIGSFDTWQSNASLKAGNSKWQSHSYFIRQSSDNDFTYKDITQSVDNPPTETRQHAGFMMNSVMQEVYHNSNAGIFEARIWWQHHDRDIGQPLTVSQTVNDETQDTEELNAMLAWKKQSGKTQWSAKAAYLYSNLHYQNTISSIDSRNYAYRYFQQLGVQRKYGQRLDLTANIQHTHTDVRSGNYIGYQKRSDITAFAGLEYLLKENVILHAMIRQKLVDGDFLPLIPSLGFDVRLLSQQGLYLKGNISRNYHLPTLNDLYWQPGGNPDLKAEEGFTLEGGLSYRAKAQARFPIDIELTYYRNDIENWILWQPPDTVSSYWQPKNIRHVVSQGLETSAKAGFLWGSVKGFWKHAYNYTHASQTEKTTSTDGAVGKQLIYVPKHNYHSLIHLSQRNTTLDILYRYTGKRFLTSDNTSYLPAFETLDVSLGKAFSYKQYALQLRAKVNNLLDEQYQVVAWYPMPGRYFQFSITIKFDK